MLAKQMNQRQKNMVMIGAGQINNTVNENAIIPTIIKNNNNKAMQRLLLLPPK